MTTPDPAPEPRHNKHYLTGKGQYVAEVFCILLLMWPITRLMEDVHSGANWALFGAVFFVCFCLNFYRRMYLTDYKDNT